MKAAGLKAIDTVVETISVLVKSKKTQNPLVDLIASRIRGVISKFLPSSSLYHPTSPIDSSLLCSRPKIRSVPVQHPPWRTGHRLQDHPRQARTHGDRPGRRRLGCRQLDGREEEDRDGHGRPDQGWRNGYSGPEHRQLENGLSLKSIFVVMQIFFFLFLSCIGRAFHFFRIIFFSLLFSYDQNIIGILDG